MEHISRAWTVVSRDLLQWIVVFVVMCLVSIFTCGLGALLVGPNFMLVARRSIDRGAPPEIGGLFETDLFVEYIVYWILMIVLSVIGSWVPLIGALIVSTLTFWTLPLIVDRKFGAVDAIQASFHHAKGAFFDLLVFTIVVYVLGVAGMCACFAGLLVVGPLTAVATTLYYDAEKDRILAAAINAGLRPLS